MTAYLPVPVIQKAVWAQCENPNCGKWRKLPPGATIEENEPWYCFMNPDHERNTCSASEMVSPSAVLRRRLLGWRPAQTVVHPLFDAVPVTLIAGI